MTKWLLALAWALLILYLTTLPDFHPSSNSMLSFLLSNGGHFFFFGIQAVLLYKLIKRPVLWSALYGLAIELLQRYVPGRSFSLIDLGLDALGAWLFISAMRKYKR